MHLLYHKENIYILIFFFQDISKKVYSCTVEKKLSKDQTCQSHEGVWCIVFPFNFMLL